MNLLLEVVKEGRVSILNINVKEMIADGLTKALDFGCSTSFRSR